MARQLRVVDLQHEAGNGTRQPHDSSCSYMTEAIKDEAIRRGLKKAEGQFWKLALTPPGQSNRTDKSRLLAFLGLSESQYETRFTSPTQTDWVMRCTAKKVLRTAEQETVVLPPAKAQRAA